MARIRPNLFIVGAPKSGTTSLAVYLGEHPDIYMLKGWEEPHFFGSDLSTKQRFEGDEQAYLGLFAGAEGYKRIGEKSTWYLYSQRAAREIKALAPESKIIIMLRNPVDMMYSLHAHNLYRGYEDLENFEEALAAQPYREAGQCIPSTVRLVDHLFYTRVPRYSEQVQRYFDAFGQENVLVIVFEAFKQDNGKIYQETIEFLGLDPAFLPSFQVWNRRREVRSRRLQDFYRNPPKILSSGVGKIALATPVRSLMMRLLRKINVIHKPPAPLRSTLRHQLEAEFHEEIEKLAQMTGSDLSMWTSCCRKGERIPSSSFDNRSR